MQRFKIGLLLILLFLFAVWIQPSDSVAGKWYGTFGTTDSPRDTVLICFSTFDTLAYSADPGSVWVWRYYHGSIVDSNYLDPDSLDTYRNGNHLGEFCIRKQAYNRDFGKGIYDVTVRWLITGKEFSVSGSYEVRDELGYNQDMWAEIKRQSDGVRDPQEYHPGVQMHDFEDSTDWSVYGTGALMFKDETNFVEGFQGVKLVSQDGNVARLEAEIGTQEYHIANFSFYAYVDPVTRPYLGDQDQTSDLLSLKLLIGSGAVGASWTVYMSYTFPDTHIVTGWNKFCIPADAFVATGGASWDGTTMIRIGLEIDTRDAGDSVAVTFDDQCRDRRARATFMFRFDDAAETIYDSGFYTLEQYNFPAHVNFMTNQVGQATCLTLAELEEMYSKDWDICSHGDDGSGLEGMARGVQLQTLMRAQRWLMQNGFSRSAGYHGWGLDEYDSISINIARENFEFASGGRNCLFHDHIDFTDSLSERRFTAPIKVMYTWTTSDTTGAADVTAWIDSTIMSGGLLIMVFHSFTGAHSGGSCHVDTLIEICDYLYEHRGLIDVVTPTQYIDVLYRDPYEAVVRAKEIKVVADSTLERLIAFKDSVENAVTVLRDSIHLRALEQSIQNMYTEVLATRDTTNAILDTLQEGFGSRTTIGDTIQREASVFVASTDSVQLYDSSITHNTFEEDAIKNTAIATDAFTADEAANSFWLDGDGYIADAVFDEIKSGHTTENSFGELLNDVEDSLLKVRNYSYAVQESINAHAPHGDDWGQGAGDLTAITDTINAILDTLQLYENAGRFQANIQDVLDTLKVYDGTLQAVVQEILDTLQVYDDAGKFQIEIAEILDSLKTYDGTIHSIIQEILDTLQVYDGTFQIVVDDILDSLKTYDGTIHAVIQEILDTLQVYDGTLQSKVQDIADTSNALLDTVQAHAPHGDNWASTGAGVDLSDEVDSILAVIYDRTNDSNFVRLIAHVILNYDSAQFSDEFWTTIDSRLTNRSAIGDTNTNPFDNSADKVTLVDSSAGDISYVANYPDDYKASLDSLETAVTDANKANFKATGFATADSIHNAITDANKANFKATGFSVAGDPMTLQADSLEILMTDIDAIKAKTDNLPPDPADDSDVDAQLSTIQVDLDNPTQYKATGFATSTQGDSITGAITDVNKANFKATGFATASDLDSVEGAIADANKPNFRATGFATSSQGDSLTGAITDANKANFKSTGFATSTQGDSLTGAIADANKGNFKASGFAVSGDPMTLQGDSLATLMTDVDGIKTKTDNLPTDPADDSDMDAQLSSIQSDLDDPGQYKATGFATSTQGDSITGAIMDANKDNFKFGMGAGDSVKAYLSTGDSTLLELAAGGASNWSNDQRDSVLNTILDANKPNYKATGFAVAGDVMTLQSDSLNTLMADVDSIVGAVSDANKPNFKATGYAVAGDPMTLQDDSLKTLMEDVDSLTNAVADANKPNFYTWSTTERDSVLNAIEDANKANFKYGAGIDSVRAYLATHDSTLLELASGGASNWSDAQRDSILNTILDANKPNYRASGFATPGDAMTFADDSLETLMTDVDAIKAKTDNLPTDPADDSDIDNQLSSIQQDLNNPDQYKATGFAVAGDVMTLQDDSLATLMGDVDSVVAAITDANKANFKADVDSMDNAIADANKVNFKADVDSMNNAITDANKVNFKASGFAVTGDPMTLQSDSLATMMTDIDGIKSKTDNLPTDPADDSDIDAQLNSIATDLNNPNQYKADITDVWRNQDTTHIDSSNIGVWLVNNTGGAGSSNWSDAQRDSILAVIADAGKIGAIRDTIDDHAPHDDNWGSGGSSVWSQAEQDSVMDGLFGGGDDHDRDSNMIYMLMDDVDAIKAKTDNLPSDPADQSLLVIEIDANETKIDGIDDNPWDNAKSDTTSGVGDWFADWFNADWWLTSSGDTNTNSFQAGTDDVFLNANYAQIANDNYDTMYVHRTDFQGAGAAVASEIADTLANRGYVTGAGVFACTVFAKLDADSSAIDGIHVIALNTNQDNKLAHCYTNANGWCVLGLDSIAGGAYHKFWLINVDYSFTFPESADVNTDTGIIFYGSVFDYGDPPAGNNCAVYDQMFNAQLESLSNVVVTAEVRVPADSILRYDDRIISPFKVSDTTGVDGRWRIDLIPNSDYLPSNTWYIFTFKYRDTWGGWVVREDSVQVPDSTSARYKILKGW